MRDLLERGVTNIIPDKKKLTELIASGKKLNVYLGIDPTATRIHLGHAVPLRKLNEFAENGHNVVFLIGDFTALIGDTSDKDKERPVLTYEQIEENFKTYKEQAEKIVDFSKVQVTFNSEWLNKLNFSEIVKLCQHFSVGEFVNRELIRNRLNSGGHVALHEVLYPVMQGYDSYFMDTDVQIGGADQTFNMQAGRQLQKDLRDKESFVLVTGYLEGTDGRKMSKSWGNAIWINDEPNEMYGKVMSVRDELLITYFTLATNLPMGEIHEKEERLKNGENPITIKAELAEEIVTELHGGEQAKEAQNYFNKTFREGSMPDKSIEYIAEDAVRIEEPIIKLGLRKSKGEVKRLIKQGGLEIDGATITDPAYMVEPTDKPIEVKVGKKDFFKIIKK